MASRDTRSRLDPGWNRPCASSVMAGTCFEQPQRVRTRRSSIDLADHGNCVVQPSWLSILLDELPDLRRPPPRLARAEYGSAPPSVLAIVEENLENPVGQQRPRPPPRRTARPYLVKRRLRDFRARSYLPPAPLRASGDAAQRRVFRTCPGCRENAHPVQVSKNRRALVSCGSGGDD